MIPLCSSYMHDMHVPAYIILVYQIPCALGLRVRGSTSQASGSWFQATFVADEANLHHRTCPMR